MAHAHMRAVLNRFAILLHDVGLQDYFPTYWDQKLPQDRVHYVAVERGSQEWGSVLQQGRGAFDAMEVNIMLIP